MGRLCFDLGQKRETGCLHLSEEQGGRLDEWLHSTGESGSRSARGDTGQGESYGPASLGRTLGHISDKGTRDSGLTRETLDWHYRSSLEVRPASCSAECTELLGILERAGEAPDGLCTLRLGLLGCLC